MLCHAHIVKLPIATRSVLLELFVAQTYSMAFKVEYYYITLAISSYIAFLSFGTPTTSYVFNLKHYIKFWLN